MPLGDRRGELPGGSVVGDDRRRLRRHLADLEVLEGDAAALAGNRHEGFAVGSVGQLPMDLDVTAARALRLGGLHECRVVDADLVQDGAFHGLSAGAVSLHDDLFDDHRRDLDPRRVPENARIFLQPSQKNADVHARHGADVSGVREEQLVNDVKPGFDPAVKHAPTKWLARWFLRWLD
jgi:hypothetical protein